MIKKQEIDINGINISKGDLEEVLVRSRYAGIFADLLRRLRGRNGSRVNCWCAYENLRHDAYCNELQVWMNKWIVSLGFPPEKY